MVEETKRGIEKTSEEEEKATVSAVIHPRREKKK